jgi:WD40 repeat protein
VYAVAFSSDSRWLAGGGRERSAPRAAWEHIFGRSKSAGNGDTIRLWSAQSGALSQVLSAHSGDVHGLAFSPDGRWLASSGDDRAVRLWSLTPREPARR